MRDEQCPLLVVDTELIQPLRCRDQRRPGAAGTVIDGNPPMLIQPLPDVFFRHGHGCHRLADAERTEALPMRLTPHIQLHVHIPEEVLERVPFQALHEDPEELHESVKLLGLILGSNPAVGLFSLLLVIPANMIDDPDREQIDHVIPSVPSVIPVADAVEYLYEIPGILSPDLSGHFRPSCCLRLPYEQVSSADDTR